MDRLPIELPQRLRFDVRVCVHCGLCLPACPTYRQLGQEADGPRGRVAIMKALADGEVPLTRAAELHIDRCLGCRACETACPSGVPYGRLLEDTRSALSPLQEARRAAEHPLRKQWESQADGCWWTPGMKFPPPTVAWSFHA